MPVYDTLTKVPEWLNTSRSLTPEDLQGRVLLVDFWTYCCINCLHVIPKLQELEKEFGDQLTVIGVHSAKFANESETDNIRQAIQKYGIHHPVINDEDFIVWNAFGINAWPTLLLISPDGLLKEVYRGEGDIDAIRKDVKALLQKNEGKVVTTPLPINLEANKIPPTILRFPTKLSTPDGKTLVISDSGHQRVVVVDLATDKIVQTIGSGEQGFKDGDLSEAQFNNPQGVLAEDDQIFVADTGNHRVRLIDLKMKKVTTIAGTGERGAQIVMGSPSAKRTALASPWDLTFFPDHQHIVIANAGTHQLWTLDRVSGNLSLLAGNGREDIVDGALPFNSLAQTSGLSPLGDKLYFVDAETSSLRVYQKGQVQTLIGTGLFDFGLKDGKQDVALMQHPLGLYADEDGTVWVADTYNNTIRSYKNEYLSDTTMDKVKEPNAILKIGDTFYIADTNNHRIVTAAVDDGKVIPLDIMPMDKPVKYVEKLPNPLFARESDIDTQVTVDFDLPKNWHINPDAPSYIGLFNDGKNLIAQFNKDDVVKGGLRFSGLQPDKHYTVQGVVYYCATKKGSQCLIRGVQADLHVAVEPVEKSAITFVLPPGTK